MRTSLVRWAAATRPLSPVNVLNTVRNDPGMTAAYYANRYYGKENVMQVNHMLWSVLKRGGKVDIDRADGADAPPRWYPLFATPRRHNVRQHNADEEDLSLLRRPHPPTAPVAPTMPFGEPTSDCPIAATSSWSSSDKQEGTEEAEVMASEELENAIVGLVEAFPGQDIQRYIADLPANMQRRAPSAFKRLREAGLLKRRVTEQGTYVWD
ncbi:putative mitochondrial hypothetical protein [Leptomonas pyrrhocoris]|uniref:Uncharacterized protein n=1 Tax=Leptomonas pyrrhocoris TaxID=157538 RepID=A0A0N0DWP1_LEPPY|nr:putative mitochondrial hypothetical protein [Leptomonas pyrrhocoris]KPA81862.1 putative mitochondrial hypothetical protein [Leptomonas pyrrhocoris]|eukprot:XP_015660301.1 putative mitochondrial hypothetical protein [Leptomonas pyrrhocoris]